MTDSQGSIYRHFNPLGSTKGFTLIELAVALVIGAIVLAGMYASYYVQQKSYKRQSMVVAAQQNIRGSLNLMEEEIRMAGLDMLQTGSFGITGILLDGNGNGTLTFTTDNGSGSNADNGTLDGDETISYSLYDADTTVAVGDMDLGRSTGAGTQLVAEKIEALGFAYAFDDDEDGSLDGPAAGEVFWAVDSDMDNDLDLNLDTNGDGRIDINDSAAGEVLPAEIDPNRIRAVRVFLLARTKGADFGHQDNNIYVVSYKRLAPGDNFRRRFLTATIKCRNLGL